MISARRFFASRTFGPVGTARSVMPRLATVILSAGMPQPGGGYIVIPPQGSSTQVLPLPGGQGWLVVPPPGQATTTVLPLPGSTPPVDGSTMLLAILG